MAATTSCIKWFDMQTIRTSNVFSTYSCHNSRLADVLLSSHVLQGSFVHSLQHSNCVHKNDLLSRPVQQTPLQLAPGYCCCAIDCLVFLQLQQLISTLNVCVVVSRRALAELRHSSGYRTHIDQRNATLDGRCHADSRQRVSLRRSSLHLPSDCRRLARRTPKSNL